MRTKTLAALMGACLVALPIYPQADPSATSPFVTPGIAHPGTDQMFWVPTYAQAEEMAKATGRTIFVIIYCAGFEGY